MRKGEDREMREIVSSPDRRVEMEGLRNWVCEMLSSKIDEKKKRK